MKFKENFKRFMTLNRHHDGGFTLVELIVVIAILAILAGVAVPVYSGYIKKAEKAGDLQLLGAINQAYVAACFEKNVAPANGTQLKVTDHKLVIPEGGVWDAFSVYYGDNRNTAFKSVESGSLVYNIDKGGFQLPGEAQVVYNPETNSYTITTSTGHAVNVSKDDVDVFMGGTFGTDMDSSVLLGKVDYVTNLAAGIMENPDSKLTAILASTKYGDALAAMLNADSVESAVADLIKNKLKQDNPGITDAEIEQIIATEGGTGDGIDPAHSAAYNKAFNQIVANNAVLYAAQNTAAAAGKNEDGSYQILSMLGNGSATDTILTNMQKVETSDTALAQAAMAYGLYTAYANRTGITISSDPSTALQAMKEDREFQAYVNGQKTDKNDFTGGQAAADLDSYLAAMNMINANTGNSALVENVLINGFNTQDLSDLLNGAKQP